MITQFKEVGSKKLLKELYLTGCVPGVDNYIKINGITYRVKSMLFDTDNCKWVLWVHKLQRQP